MMEIPVIDMAPWYHGGAEGRAAVAADVARACEEIGFLTVINHGVDESVIGRCYQTARSFFELPAAVKERVRQPSPDQVRGYSAVGAEGLSYSLDEVTPGDLKESFSVGPPDVPPDDPYFHHPDAGPHFAPNLWPVDPPGMQEAWTEYFTEMARLAHALMASFALALDLPPAYFDDKIDRHISMLRALNYPSQPVEPLPGQLRAGAHSDYGSLTILRQEQAPGGLQVRTRDGAWLDVPVVAGALVVNIGDLMMQWTNDRWISTMHRVVNPPRADAHEARRISLVFFHQPNYDARVESLDRSAPAKYPPVSSGDHLLGKFLKQSTFGGTK